MILDEERVEKLLAFLKEIEKLKLVNRSVFTSSMRNENSAEHSWHLGMFLLLFEKDLFQGLDVERMLKMSLVHDLVEVYAGDTFAFDKEAQKFKNKKEMDAAERLFSQLPDDIREELMDLFVEYEERNTTEAKMVQSFDKIQAQIQNVCSEGKGWKDKKITIDVIDEYNKKFVDHDERTVKIFEKIITEAKEKGLVWSEE